MLWNTVSRAAYEGYSCSKISVQSATEQFTLLLHATAFSNVKLFRTIKFRISGLRAKQPLSKAYYTFFHINCVHNK